MKKKKKQNLGVCIPTRALATFSAEVIGGILYACPPITGPGSKCQNIIDRIFWSCWGFYATEGPLPSGDDQGTAWPLRQTLDTSQFLASTKRQTRLRDQCPSPAALSGARGVSVGGGKSVDTRRSRSLWISLLRHLVAWRSVKGAVFFFRLTFRGSPLRAGFAMCRLC